MSQEPLQVPPKPQPGEMDAITEALYRSDDPPTLIRETPLVESPQGTYLIPANQGKRAKPKRAQKEPDDSIGKALGLIVGLSFLAALVGGFLGYVLASYAL